MTGEVESAGSAIEAGQPWEVRAFRPEDAEGAAGLFRAFYGRRYPIRAYVEPQRLMEENRAQRILSSVAVTPRGEVVGHNAIFRSAHFEGIYETGAGIVHPAYSGGKGILTAMVAHGVREIAPRLGLAGIHGEAVCNHVFSQKMMHGLGAWSCAIEVDLMPAAAYGRQPGASGRVAAVYGHIALQPRPHAIFVPPAYREDFDLILARAGERRETVPAAGGLPAGCATRVEERYFDFAQAARLSVLEAGGDFDGVLENMERALFPRGAHLVQVLLPLSRPWVGAAVDALRSRGYFLGGLLPRWFDTDGLLMQKTARRPDWEGIRLEFDSDRRLLERVRADWERRAGGQGA